MSTTIEMSDYTVGSDAYREIPAVCAAQRMDKVVLIGGKRVESLLRIGRRSLRLVIFRGFVRRRRTRARRILRRCITQTGVEGRLLRKADYPQCENQGGDNDACGNQGNNRRSGNHAFASASLSLCLELRPRRS